MRESIRVNDIVEFKELYPDEGPCQYKVLEVNGGRSLIEVYGWNWPILPTQIVLTNDLKVVTQ